MLKEEYAQIESEVKREVGEEEKAEEEENEEEEEVVRGRNSNSRRKI